MRLLPDLIDAEFETLRPDPSARLAAPAPSATIGTSTAPSQGLDTLRKGEVPAKQPRLARRPALLDRRTGARARRVLGVGWACAGAPDGTDAGGAANPARQPAEEIVDVTSKIEERDGRSILFVDGTAVNQGSGEQTLPPIEISVTATDGKVMRYNLGTSLEPLAAGGEFSFSSRLEAPKEGVKSVSVTFQG